MTGFIDLQNVAEFGTSQLTPLAQAYFGISIVESVIHRLMDMAVAEDPEGIDILLKLQVCEPHSDRHDEIQKLRDELEAVICANTGYMPYEIMDTLAGRIDNKESIYSEDICLETVFLVLLIAAIDFTALIWEKELGHMRAKRIAQIWQAVLAMDKV